MKNRIHQRRKSASKHISEPGKTLTVFSAVENLIEEIKDKSMRYNFNCFDFHEMRREIDAEDHPFACIGGGGDFFEIASTYVFKQLQELTFSEFKNLLLSADNWNTDSNDYTDWLKYQHECGDLEKILTALYLKICVRHLYAETKTILEKLGDLPDAKLNWKVNSAVSKFPYDENLVFNFWYWGEDSMIHNSRFATVNLHDLKTQIIDFVFTKLMIMFSNDKGKINALKEKENIAQANSAQQKIIIQQGEVIKPKKKKERRGARQKYFDVYIEILRSGYKSILEFKEARSKLGIMKSDFVDYQIESAMTILFSEYKTIRERIEVLAAELKKELEEYGDQMLNLTERKNLVKGRIVEGLRGVFARNNASLNFEELLQHFEKKIKVLRDKKLN